jgi:ubiquinol-cytochrome c reductase cytochrome b subunit
MSENVKQSWSATRLPAFSQWWARSKAPTHAPDGPYLAALPALITGLLILLGLSGLVLAVYYNPSHPFASLQFIAWNVANGWLVRGFHATGTTILFGTIYLFLFRGIATRAYKAPGELAWFATVALYALLLLTAWLGQTLTGGGAAYWSLKNAAQAAGLLGGAPGAVATWFFGGPAGHGTLARLVVFHIALALLAFALLWLYCAAAKPAARIATGAKPVAFFPYYIAQYFAAFAILALIFSVFLFFAPHFGENPLDLVAGSDLVVPTTITPPWYLVPLAAMSGLFTSPAGAIWVVVAALAVLFALPWLDRSGPQTRHGGWYRFFAVLLALDILGLSLAGAAGPSLITAILTILFTFWYFLHFLVLTPLVTALEAE